MIINTTSRSNFITPISTEPVKIPPAYVGSIDELAYFSEALSRSHFGDSDNPFEYLGLYTGIHSAKNKITDLLTKGYVIVAISRHCISNVILKEGENNRRIIIGRIAFRNPKLKRIDYLDCIIYDGLNINDEQYELIDQESIVEGFIQTVTVEQFAKRTANSDSFSPLRLLTFAKTLNTEG
mgnify:FL=1